MVVKQIYNIVNAANKQAFGENAIEVIDLQGVISTGNTVLSTATNKDLWFKAIADKITKTIISTNLNINDIFNNYEERIGSRIAGYYDIYYFFGEDLRFKK